MVKRSVSLPEVLAHDVEAAAAEDGLSFSTWLATAAERQLQVRDGLRAVAEWEARAGALSDDEAADGDALLARLLAGLSARVRPGVVAKVVPSVSAKVRRR